LEFAMHRPVTRAIAAALAAVAIQVLMITAFGWPSARQAPRDVPLVVAGPQAATSAVAGRLTAERPGAFKIARVPDEAAARTALTDRTAYGAIVVAPTGPRVLVASAASPALAQQLGQLAQRLSGAPAPPTQDVVPSDGDDPRGAALASMVLPLILSGLAGGVLLTFLVSSIGWRLAGLVAFAAGGGAATAAIAQGWLSVLPGDFLAVAGVAGLGSLAVAGAVTGLGAVIGRPGIGLAALTMVLLGNPLSGVTSAPELLPQPWGAIGQALPPGATVTLLRSVAYFDGAGAAAPLTVLLIWAAAGILLTSAGVFRRTRSRAAAVDQRATAALA
jgi:hypothetical protein